MEREEEADIIDGVQTRHVREMAANLVLSRALRQLDAAGGVTRFKDLDGDWHRDSFVLPGRADLIAVLAPVLNALLDWTLYTERPVAIRDLRASRWSQHLLDSVEPPAAAVAATPLAQRGSIWGAITVYRDGALDDAMAFLGQLAELATEPLSSLGAGRPEGVR